MAKKIGFYTYEGYVSKPPKYFHILNIAFVNIRESCLRCKVSKCAFI